MTHTIADISADMRLWQLGETMAYEYAGALSAEKVVRTVSKAARTMRHLKLSDSVFWEFTEQTARRELTDLLAQTARPTSSTAR